MWGTVGRIWRRTCDQFWGSLKKNFSRRDEGVLRTEKGEKEVAQQFVNVGTVTLAKRSNLKLMR